MTPEFFLQRIRTHQNISDIAAQEFNGSVQIILDRGIVKVLDDFGLGNSHRLKIWLSLSAANLACLSSLVTFDP